MPTENCACGGNVIERFYSLFTCEHVNCDQCHWTLNKCCNGCYSSSDDDSNCNKSKCLNYYDIKMQDVIQSRIKAFGYCDNHRALAVQFTDGTKRLYLNVDKEFYEFLVTLNRDNLFMHLQENMCDEYTQCIDIP